MITRTRELMYFGDKCAFCQALFHARAYDFYRRAFQRDFVKYKCGATVVWEKDNQIVELEMCTDIPNVTKTVCGKCLGVMIYDGMHYNGEYYYMSFSCGNNLKIYQSPKFYTEMSRKFIVSAKTCEAVEVLVRIDKKWLREPIR